MIQAQEREIELVLTYKCNWNCEYCCVDTHNKDDISFEIIKEKLNKVLPNYNVTLSGGEIGLMRENEILYVIDKLLEKQCKISLNTNGVFLKKYPHLAKYFEYVLYHCSENLIEDPDWESINNFKNHNDAVNVELMIVVTDNNIKDLDTFLTRNSNYTFHVVASTYADGGLDVTLSNANRYKIMSKRFDNISKESLKRLIIKEKNFGSIIYI